MAFVQKKPNSLVTTEMVENIIKGIYNIINASEMLINMFN